MRALVTGGTGFVGSHLTELLVEQGHAVAVLRRPATRPWRIERLLPRVTTIAGDLDDVAAAAPAIERFAPDTVFHLGWQGVGRAERDDARQQAPNLVGTQRLLRAARDAGCRTFIGLGSQAEYGPQNRRLDERAPACPLSEYGRAKLQVYQAGRSFARDLGLRFAWIRLFSAYGPGDHPQSLIATLAETLLRGESPRLTPGGQRWDYLDVGDAAEAIAAVARTPGAEGVFNLGSGTTTTIRRVAETVRDLIDPSLELGLGAVPYRPDQLMHLEADVSRLTALTGWTARTPLTAGLRRTVEWHRRQAGLSGASCPLRKGIAA